MSKRLLSDDEKKFYHDLRTAHERHDYPDHEITVMVWDETDDDGNPKFTVTLQKDVVWKVLKPRA